MNRVAPGRLALGAAGLVLIVLGLVGVAGLRPSTLVSFVVYLGAGVIAHDALLAPAVVLLGVLVSKRLPRAWATPLVVATVVWGSLTLLAVPVLGRFGAKADNPTLLDRGYLTAWWVGTALVGVLVVVAGAVRRTRSQA